MQTPGYAYCEPDDSDPARSVLSVVVYCVSRELQFMPCPPAFVKAHAELNHCPASVYFPPV